MARRGVRWRVFTIVLALAVLGASSPAVAEITVRDYRDRPVRLERPAARIVALAPHVVENLYSAGLGDRLVGAVAYSDYPPAARTLPDVGTATNLSLESIVALDPDLVIAWASGQGASAWLLSRLDALGIAVYVDRPQALDDIARSIVDFGRLGGRGPPARAVAADFRQRLARLRTRYAERAPVRVFYQVWNEPLQTIGADQFVGHVIDLCGGRNIFADAATAAPRIGIESVLARDPDVIVASGTGDARPDWLDDWKTWPGLQAVANGHLYFVAPDLIQRPTVRILDGAATLCADLDRARD